MLVVGELWLYEKFFLHFGFIYLEVNTAWQWGKSAWGPCGLNIKTKYANEKWIMTTSVL